MHAVIMTGGKGLRMAPYTKVLPKGLLPVGNRPILEIIVGQLQAHGFTSITMACGYLASLIQNYFGDGSDHHVSINYHLEDQPLGTVGPLKHIEFKDEPILMINCDVLTTLDLRTLYNFHLAQPTALTIASQLKKTPLDLGVLETNGETVTGFLEKPTRSERVSMGIYIVSPDVVPYIPEGRAFDVPDLIHLLLQNQLPIRHYANDSYWLDIGKPADYHKANEDLPSLLPHLKRRDLP